MALEPSGSWTGSAFAGVVTARSGQIASGTPTAEGADIDLATVETVSTGASDPISPPRLARRVFRSAHVDPRFIHQASALFEACAENLERAIECEDAFFERSNSLSHAKDSLSRLWDLRAHREEQFAEIVNLLQAVLTDRTIESFSNAQWACVKSVLLELRDAADAYDDDQANRITVELLRGGIDVFREMD